MQLRRVRLPFVCSTDLLRKGLDCFPLFTSRYRHLEFHAFIREHLSVLDNIWSNKKRFKSVSYSSSRMIQSVRLKNVHV